MQPTALPAQAAPDPGALLVWLPAVGLLFLVAVAYVERRTLRDLRAAGDLDPEIARGRAWSMVLAAGLLVATFALGLVVVMLVVSAFPFDDLAERTAWIVGPLLSFGIALSVVWWLGRPVELTPLAEPAEDDGRDASEPSRADAGKADARADGNARRTE